MLQKVRVVAGGVMQAPENLILCFDDTQMHGVATKAGVWSICVQRDAFRGQKIPTGGVTYVLLRFLVRHERNRGV